MKTTAITQGSAARQHTDKHLQRERHRSQRPVLGVSEAVSQNDQHDQRRRQRGRDQVDQHPLGVAAKRIHDHGRNGAPGRQHDASVVQLVEVVAVMLAVAPEGVEQRAEREHAQASDRQRNQAQRVADAARALVDRDRQIREQVQEHEEADPVREDVAGLVVQIAPRPDAFQPAAHSSQQHNAKTRHALFVTEFPKSARLPDRIVAPLTWIQTPAGSACG